MGNIVRTTGISIDVVNRYVLCALETMDVGAVIGADFDPPYFARLHIEHIVSGIITATDVDIPLEFIASAWRINRPNWRYVLPVDTVIVNCSIRSEASSANHSYSVQTSTNSYTVQGNNGFVPQHRDGEFLIKDFTKLVGIEKVNSKYKTRDIAFIDTQTRSMQQASAKCKAIQNSPDPTFSLIYRTKANKNEEWSARITPSMREALGEIARIIDFAATDIRTLQKFDLTNKFFTKLV